MSKAMPSPLLEHRLAGSDLVRGCDAEDTRAFFVQSSTRTDLKANWSFSDLTERAANAVFVKFSISKEEARSLKLARHANQISPFNTLFHSLRSQSQGRR